MIDSAQCMLSDWEPREIEMLEEKHCLDLNQHYDETNVERKNFANYYLNSDIESVKPSLLSDNSSTKSEVTLNSLKHKQNTLIQQRIQDRIVGLRNMNNSSSASWTNHNYFTPRLSMSNFDLLFAGAKTDPGLLTNQISSCAFGTNNQTMQLFNHTNQTSDAWPVDYTQDTAMRSRPCFSSHQTRELELEFSVCQYITRRRRVELAFALTLTEKQIKTWFQNRRVKDRKQKKTTGEFKDTEMKGNET